MTRSDLLALVYHFYPRGLYVDGLGYDDTEERYRQCEAVRRGAAEYPTWKAMLRRLRARYPFTDHAMGVLGGSLMPGYSAEIEIPGHLLGFHVSLLGPYYGIRRLGAPGEDLAALDLAREIEATYPGYEPIPPELGDEVVPDVTLDKRLFGEATVYDCLLAQEWAESSGPYDSLRSPDYVDPDAPVTEEAPAPTGVEREMPIHVKDGPGWLR
jgi:hypothetical protein